VTTLGNYSLPVECVPVFSKVINMRPDAITTLDEDVSYFQGEGVGFQEFIPSLSSFLERYIALAKRVDTTTSIEELTTLRDRLYNIKNEKDDEGLGCFSDTIYFLMGDEISKVNRHRAELDKRVYRKLFHTNLPDKIFDLFSRDQSVQGTMAASEVLAGESFSDVLNGELNLAYPGAGNHFTPLIIAFDLISRGKIESAGLLFNDIANNNPRLINTLQNLAEKGAIENLILGETSPNDKQTKYTFTYMGKNISVYYLVENMTDVANWNPGDRSLLSSKTKCTTHSRIG